MSTLSKAEEALVESRVAKMEAGDPSVSIDLLIRSLLAMGTTQKELAQVMGRALRPARQSPP